MEWKSSGQPSPGGSTLLEETSHSSVHRRAKRALRRDQKLLEEAQAKAADSARSHAEWCANIARELDTIPDDPWAWLLDQPDTRFF